MPAHPTVVHAAADLRRQALLTEVSNDRLVTSTRVRVHGSGPISACRRMVMWFAGSISRIIDDFEPDPAPLRRIPGR